MVHVVMVRSHYPDTRLQKEAASLKKGGNSVRLLVWDRGKLPASPDASGCEVKRFSARVQPDQLLVALYLPFWWLFVALDLALRDFDIVHAADFDTFLPAVIVAKARRKRIVYDIYDFYAEMIRFPVLPNLSKTCIAAVDRFLMQHADAIILPDPARMEQVGTAGAGKVAVVANSPSAEMLDGVRPNRNDGRFTVFYGGFVTGDRCIGEICQAIRDLPDVALSVAGPCSDEYQAELRQICREAGNIELSFGWLPYQEILARTLGADCLVALYDPRVPNNRYASPNKLFEAMLCGKPIVVNGGTSMTAIVETTGCGIVVPFGDHDALRDAILRLKSDSSLRERLGRNARTAYDRLYRWGIMEERLLAVYRDLEAPGRLLSSEERPQQSRSFRG